MSDVLSGFTGNLIKTILLEPFQLFNFIALILVYDGLKQLNKTIKGKGSDINANGR